MNPYEVLGVNPGDDEETIKKAYRNLVKKYHPDRYVNTPMADEATGKLKRINEAYDMITNKKTNRSYSQGGYSSNTYQNFNVSFDSVRMLIRMHQISHAEQMLLKLEKNAEWYYLMGLVYINKGWYDMGKEYIERAISMAPDNMEYRQTLNSFNNRNRNFHEYKMEYTNCCSPYGFANCLCASLFCSRCCCCI